MKYFKLFENFNKSNALMQSLFFEQSVIFCDAVEKIFQSNGSPIEYTYTTEGGEEDTIEIKPDGINPGSKNQFTDKPSFVEDVKLYMADYDKPLILTFAGKTRKIRTPYGERICELGSVDGVNKKGKLNNLYLDRIYTLALCSQIPNIDIREKAASGIGYEEMQIDNLDKGLTEIFSNVGNANPKPLPLFINGQDMGVSINGGVKVEGSPKSDLAFGDSGKSNFWVSYKHGEYINDEGVADKVSFQQYGSISSFFKPKFDKAVGNKDIKTIMNKFFDRVKVEADSDVIPNRNFEGVTKVEFPKLPINEKTGKGKTHQCIVVTHKNGEDTIKPGESQIDEDMIKQLAGNKPSLDKVVGNKFNLTILATSGWSARESIMDLGKIGTDITLLSIFGIDYGGKPGRDNVNVLMQDAAPFKIKMRMDKYEEVIGIDVTTSSNGHVMFNPKLYGDSKTPPEFLEKYEPYIVARYTGGNHWYWPQSNPTKGIIGVRGLIMPKYHSKDDTDI